LQREEHLLGRDVGVVEDLVGGPARRDEEAQLRLNTNALFFEPNPMQLHSAFAKDVSRDSFGT
jgi:hypothetical protein